MGEKMAQMHEKKRTAKLDQKNHVNAACEGVAVFGWITYPKAPMKHVEETKESVKFYTNKVLTETKNGYVLFLVNCMRNRCFGIVVRPNPLR